MLIIVAQSTVVPVAASSPEGGDWVDGAECALRGYTTLIPYYENIPQCETPDEDNVQTWSDIYASAGANAQIQESVTTVMNNNINASRSLLWCKGKAVAVEGLKNNQTETQTRDDVNQTVLNHTAGLEKNLFTSYNTQALQMAHLLEVNEDTQGSQDPYMALGADWGDTRPDSEGVQMEHRAVWNESSTGSGVTSYNMTNGTYVTATGENITFYYLHQQDLSDPTGSDEWLTMSPVNDTYRSRFVVTQPWFTGRSSDVDGSNASVAMDNIPWTQSLDSIQSMESQMQDNLNQFVTDLYNTYNASEFDNLSASEVHSACSLATMATDYNSTGYYAFAQGQLATMGLNGSVNASWQIKYIPNDTTGVYRSTSVLNTTFSTGPLGHGAHLTGAENLTWNVSDSFGNVTGVEAQFSYGGGTISSLTATNTVGDTWEVNTSNVDWSPVTHGERVGVDLVASLDTGANASRQVSGLRYVYSPNASGEVFNGQLMTEWEPSSTNGTFLNGTTYYTANATDSVYFLDQRTSNTTQMVELEGEFTITSLSHAKTGEALNETTLEDYNHQTANATLTYDQLQQILEFRDQHNDNYQSGGSGSIGFGGISLGGAAIGGLVAIAGLLVLADRASSAS
ncbi:hypothetical protein [Haloarchaeobius sp. TZWSO28]|uniref:hypothetical protein n=1 Tax=Haloarchaeobius sp. TZWSO28 TaxID=3446119 RepID=UPI003EBAF516